jgi:putative addiction module component (TIGR02574 family)
MSVLPSQISDLTIADKFELLDAIWQDIEGQHPDLSDEQSAELDLRMAKYLEDPSVVIPWKQVKGGLFQS